ncbi:MAG: permease [Acidobacteria bacterium]|nr:permease [Acidobacteriota bacterium]
MIYAALLLLTVVGGLVTYKTTASLAVLENVFVTGTLKPRPDVMPFVGGSSQLNIFVRTLNYFSTVWVALLFGVLISGAVRAFISPRWLAGLFGGGTVRPQLIAGLAGAPLMLCSCCVAPIFSSIYERSSRLGPSLAFMLAAPSLNPAALVLTFMLLGARVGTIRLAMGALGVLTTGLLAERVLGLKPSPRTAEAVSTPEADQESMMSTFARSCLKVALRTVPLIAVGVMISMLIAERLPTNGLAPSVTAIMLVALVAVLLALPTFFEIPLAMMLFAAGAPTGAAVAMLIAGPAINLPSLLTIGRSTNWKVAGSVAAAAWLFAVVGGLMASFL